MEREREGEGEGGSEREREGERVKGRHFISYRAAASAGRHSERSRPPAEPASSNQRGGEGGDMGAVYLCHAEGYSHG